MDATSSRIIRVAPATIIIFSVLFSPALFLASVLIWRGQQIPEALCLCAAYIAFVYLICSPSVELTTSQVTYRSFLNQRSIAFADIAAVSMTANPAPTIELMRKQPHGRTFSFIVKPFSKSGVVSLLNEIRANCPEARFDAVANDMSTGDFRSITRETISSRNLMRIALIVGSAAFAAAIARVLFHR
jgi:hypothetical protein